MNHFTLIVLTVSAFVLLNIAPLSAQESAAKSPARKLAVELLGERYHGIQAHVSEVPSDSPSLVTTSPSRLPGGASQAGAIPLTAIRLRLAYEGDAVRIKVDVVFDDSGMPDTTGPKYGAKNQEIASYLTREGETISVEELRPFGIEPMLLRVVTAQPRPSVPLPLLIARPEVSNNLKSVEVVSLTGAESQPNTYKIRLRNISAKNITALELYETYGDGRSSRLPQGTVSQPIIKAGAEYETQFYFNIGRRRTPQGEVTDEARQRMLVVGTVVFDDGTYEGEVETAANFAANQKGRQIQIERIVALIQELLAAPALDEAAAIEKLKADVELLRIDVEPSVLVGLLAQFPELPKPADDKKRITIEVMNGLKASRQSALFKIGEMKTSPVHNSDVSTFKQRLTFLKEDLERMSGTR